MKRYALFIGINKYEDEAINNLNCACNDAQKLSESFQNYDDVQVMLNNDVNQAKVVATVAALVKDSKPDDVFLFYFSGHSCEISGEHHLLCSDARQDLLQFDIGTIQLNAIKKLTDKPGLRRLFILDSCRTELFSNTRGVGGATTSRGVSFGSMLEPHSNKKIFPPVILTSCSSGEYAYEDQKSGHGYFTLALQKTLKMPLVSFDDFRKKLDENISMLNLPGAQTVCWNGMLAHDLPFITWQKMEAATEGTADELERLRLRLAELETSERLQKKVESAAVSEKPATDSDKWYQTGKKAYDREAYLEALNYFLKAAEQGHADAQNYLGYMYKNGWGVEQDDSIAIEWYRKAAEQGHSGAQINYTRLNQSKTKERSGSILNRFFRIFGKS